ncbi:MAG: DUF3570 domain-containing protein [Deltaproteobacteria bacterium]|nr:DUF3570 domain-containing protein [Deltaproteobacteria bacterium]
MDSIRKLTAALALLALVSTSAGCAKGPVVAREMLADPTMRFKSGRPIAALELPSPQSDDPLPPNTVTTRIQVNADPGAAVKGTWLESTLRGSVEIIGGFGIEAGYGVEYRNQLEQKLDGFDGPLNDTCASHGPDVALVLDDGTSVLRTGYRLRMAWDGWLHEPSVRARTSVLSRDTVVEVGYRRSISAVTIPADKLPARDPVDDDYNIDRLFVAIEQGFLPGWNLRLDLAMQIEEGFLQNPYRLVSLWSHRDNLEPQGIPRTEPENHPDSRIRWGALFRVRWLIQSINAALEFGAGYGSGSWRVEHSLAQVAYLQRIGDQFTLSLRGGAYHQTRALFYRDDYPDGPAGAYWSADRQLSSFVAWWADLGFSWSTFAERGRLIGMFKYFTLETGLRVLQANYAWEGMGSDNGFTNAASLAATERKWFGGGFTIGGFLSVEGGF